MAAIQRKVTLMAHTRLTDDFYFEQETPNYIGSGMDGDESWGTNIMMEHNISELQAIALTAIRTCYSPGKPSEIIKKEGKRYFGKKATDGGKGTDADRLIRMIQSSGHTSTLEHITFNFAVEGVSRALLAQLTRHRVGFSFSVQSQRYVKFGSNDKSGGFDYVIPETIANNEQAKLIFELMMFSVQEKYDELRKAGVPAEDARAVLPNAAACNITLSINLRALLDFYSKRKAGRGAQAEISGLAEDLKNAVVNVEPWLAELFEAV